MSTASAASQAPSASGIRSAVACAAGALPGGRWAIIAADGSTARTVWGGSYEPAPAPTFTTVAASASAAQICAWMRESARRVTAYVRPISS